MDSNCRATNAMLVSGPELVRREAIDIQRRSNPDVQGMVPLLVKVVPVRVGPDHRHQARPPCRSSKRMLHHTNY